MHLYPILNQYMTVMKVKFLTIYKLLPALGLMLSINHQMIAQMEQQSNMDPINHPEYKAVEEAILNYVEALYLAEPSRIAASVDTSLRKIGYYFDANENIYRDNLEMTYQQLFNLAASWNKDGNRANENSPKEIQIFEINDKSAIGKLTAEWGIDYFQLSKVNNTWKIMNVLWQSHPKDTQN